MDVPQRVANLVRGSTELRFACFCLSELTRAEVRESKMTLRDAALRFAHVPPFDVIASTIVYCVFNASSTFKHPTRLSFPP